MVPQMFLFFGLFIFAEGNITKCYDCDPSSAGNCVSPHRNNVKITHCESEGPQKKYECFSLKYRASGNSARNGMYRGCIPKRENLETCELIKRLIKDGAMVDCQTCFDRDDCNTVDF